MGHAGGLNLRWTLLRAGRAGGELLDLHVVGPGYDFESAQAWTSSST
ncbi:hypothetical protein DB30_00547 [Enhygromyxa salina]|uniref:Uncharacterized protein n=1 Tax=Enhygromyxa salina TaxID=215803 RepID=A0A0C2CYZ1_9BACT|nr:hypothetical protein DB30_00547 [Enhygromyxa salina]